MSRDDKVVYMRDSELEPSVSNNVVKRTSSFGRQMTALRDYWYCRVGNGPPGDSLVLLSAIGLIICYLVAWPVMFLHSLYKALRS